MDVLSMHHLSGFRDLCPFLILALSLPCEGYERIGQAGVQLISQTIDLHYSAVTHPPSREKVALPRQCSSRPNTSLAMELVRAFQQFGR